MKLCLTADWHFTDIQQDESRWHVIDAILWEAITRHEAQEICILGDIFQRMDVFPENMVTRVREMLLALEKPIRVLAGNHDYSDQPRTKHSQAPLQDIACDAIRIYEEITSDETGLWIPYDKIQDIQEPIQQETVFCHDLVSGAELGMYAPVILDDMHILRHFHRVKHVFAGHIHMPQTLYPPHAPDTEWTYIGSPYSVGYKEIENPRYILYDTDTEEYISIPTRQP